MPTKLTQAEFLAKAVAVHGVGRYDYSQTVYVNTKKKINIVCPTHGLFTQEGSNHLMGKGCRKCTSGGKRFNTKLFVEKSRAQHGNKYDYSAAVYTKGLDKIKIGCPLHGEFQQVASAHLQGRGCRKCADALTGRQCALDASLFISRAQAVHGKKYDYSQVLYKSCYSKVRIICPIHGAFEQRASGHLKGRGCRFCAGPFSQNTESLVEKAQAVHGKRYDYSETFYKDSTQKIKIICPKHGLFEQLPGSHIKGHGCPSCSRERTIEAKRTEWIERAGSRATLYFLRIFNSNEEFFKVGITYLSISRRYHKTGLNGYSYEVLAKHSNANATRIYEWEQSILETFAHLRYRPKRPFGGATECFSSCEEILSIFPL